jgi:SAM-dependent methyltransferase
VPEGRSSPTAGLWLRSQALAATDDQYDVLGRWVAESASATDSLLDIGSGDGDDHYLGLIRPLVGRTVGVDPDPHGSDHAGLDEWHQMSIESFATRLPGSDGSFDLALAVYVVEHVAEPTAFFLAARKCLRPGGALFLVTPNLWHYFGIAAKAAMVLGIEDKLLAALRARRAGHDHGHDHHPVAHFALAYRANSVRALRRLGAEAGFSSLEIRHLENPAVFETYFPGRSVAFPRWYARSVHRIGRPELFGTLICRFVN